MELLSNTELSRSRRGLSADEAREQRICQRLRKRKSVSVLRRAQDRILRAADVSH